MPERIDSGSPGPSSTPKQRRKYTPLGEGGPATISENQSQSICGRTGADCIGVFKVVLQNPSPVLCKFLIRWIDSEGIG